MKSKKEQAKKLIKAKINRLGSSGNTVKQGIARIRKDNAEMNELIAETKLSKEELTDLLKEIADDNDRTNKKDMK